MTSTDYKTATMNEICQWIIDGIFQEKDGKIFKHHPEDAYHPSLSGKTIELTQRLNKRRRSNRGDARVDLRHDGKRKSVNVSQIVWMQHTGIPIPEDFEIHHLDEDPTNNLFSNLICVHRLDHQKLHYSQTIDDVPF